MQTSSERILTTHIGSLPQPRELHARLEAASAASSSELDEQVVRAVEESVRRQAGVGLSVVNDGEQGKTNWAAYVHDRLNGLSGENLPRPGPREVVDFPDYYRQPSSPAAVLNRPACNGPLSWKDFSAVEKDIANLKAAAAAVDVEDVFMSSSSPGNILQLPPESLLRI